MNPDHESPEALRREFGQWRVSHPRDPGFRDEVWRRIRSGSGEGWLAYFQANPASIGAAALLVVLLGALGGTGFARMQSQADRDAVASAYVQALDARWMAASQ